MLIFLSKNYYVRKRLLHRTKYEWNIAVLFLVLVLAVISALLGVYVCSSRVIAAFLMVMVDFGFKDEFM